MVTAMMRTAAQMVSRSLFLPFLCSMLATIFWFASNHFVKARTTRKHPPQIYGLYQRNLLTFNQTIVFSIFNFITAILVKAFILLCIELLDVNDHTLRIMKLSISLILNMRPLLLVLFMHVRLDKVNIDDDAPKIEVFYIHKPEIIPRRDQEHTENVHPGFKPRSVSINITPNSECKNFTSYKASKIVFVKPVKKQNVVDNTKL